MRHMTRSPLPVLAVGAAVALGLAGCAPGDDHPGSPTPGTTPVTATTPAPTSTPASPTAQSATPADAASTRDEVKAGLAFSPGQSAQDPAPGTELTINDVRVGSHDGFDRVVFEFGGTGVPGFHADYVPEPRQQASGLPLDVAGSAYLEVMIQGTPMGMISPREDLVKTGPMNLAAGSVQGVTHGGVFEADSQYVIGLDRERPYRAYTLDSPARLVVDIQQ